VLSAPTIYSKKSATAPSFARWQLLNPYTARHASSAAFGLVGQRLVSERAENRGYSFAIGESLTTVRGAFTTGARLEYELRLVPKDALNLALWRYQWEAGPRIGPVEPMVRVGFTTLHLDVGHGVSFGMFSPRVGAGLWFKLPASRIGVSVFSEYFWRWLGNDSAFVHGLSIELQPDSAPLLKAHATSSRAHPDRL
jgi:hypothetical protein